MRTKIVAALAAWLGAAGLPCSGDPAPSPGSSQDATGSQDPTGPLDDAGKLKRLLAEDWEYQMKEFPEYATQLGYPGQNGRWTDMSLDAIERRRQKAREMLQAIRAIDRARLDAADQLNYDLFSRGFEEAVEGQRFKDDLLPISQLHGVQQDIAQMVAMMPAVRPQDYKDIQTRLRAAPRLIEEILVLLDRGLRERITLPRITLRDLPAQVKNQIPEDLARSPLFLPFTRMPASWSPEEKQAVEKEARSILLQQLYPAFRKLGDYLEKVYIPASRESIGWKDLPDGETWYAFRARRYTTTRLSPQEIHDIGMAEVKRITAEMEAIIRTTGFSGDRRAFNQFLKTDKRFFFEDAGSLLAAYRDICKRADPELARLFGKLPRLPYGIIPVPDYAAPSQTTAYYQSGSLEAGRPGYFFANTYDLASRPRWEMEALSLHEAVPGHHLQIALAQELEGVPEFRKHAHFTAFIEGWGLYAESLGGEMGFYTDPYSRYGQLTYEIWRAMRLVVDTGMHALGWSRERALEFFKEYSSKAEHDSIVEIDRYIVWPGQALGYKIGELKIRELRKRAEAALGARFDLRAFHDAVLGSGAIPLDILEGRIDAWIAAARAR